MWNWAWSLFHSQVAARHELQSLIFHGGLASPMQAPASYNSTSAPRSDRPMQRIICWSTARMATRERQNAVRIINPAAAVFVFRPLQSPSIHAAETAQSAQKWFASTSSYILGLRQCILFAACLPPAPSQSWVGALASN